MQPTLSSALLIASLLGMSVLSAGFQMRKRDVDIPSIGKLLDLLQLDMDDNGVDKLIEAVRQDNGKRLVQTLEDGAVDPAIRPKIHEASNDALDKFATAMRQKLGDDGISKLLEALRQAILSQVQRTEDGVVPAGVRAQVQDASKNAVNNALDGMAPPGVRSQVERAGNNALKDVQRAGNNALKDVQRAGNDALKDALERSPVDGIVPPGVRAQVQRAVNDTLDSVVPAGVRAHLLQTEPERPPSITGEYSYDWVIERLRQGMGSYPNVVLAVFDAAYDLVRRMAFGALADSLPVSGADMFGIHGVVKQECVTDAAKATAAGLTLEGAVPPGTRIAPECGVTAFDPHRLNRQWCEENGVLWENTAGPSAPCGTLVSGTVDNLPTDRVKGAAGSDIDLTGLFWMHDNLATTLLGEEFMTFGNAQTGDLTDFEIGKFESLDNTLLLSKGFTSKLPDFKVALNTNVHDERWSYDDRCLSTNGLMRNESLKAFNDWVFYIWLDPAGVLPPFGMVNDGNWGATGVWTFEFRHEFDSLGNKKPPGDVIFRGIYEWASANATGDSYTLLKVLDANGDAVISDEWGNHWERFLDHAKSNSIKSILTWHDECQCKRQCALTQINLVQGGCVNQQFGLEFPYFIGKTPEQDEALAIAQDCCQCTEC